MLLSERIWRDRFGRSDTIVGRTVRLDDRAYEVVGVLPRTFHAIAPLGFSPDLWVQADPTGVHAGISTDRAATRFEVFGRLKPGDSTDAAQAAMRVLGAQLAAEHPEVNARFGGTEVFLAGGINVYRGVGKTLLPVFVFIGFAALLAALVLLMSCANLAGLLLGRAAARRQEIAVRLALGAGRARLLRQLLTESLVLAALGAACGLVLATWLARGVAFLVAQLPFPIELNLSPDVRVLAYTVGVTAGCAVLFGVAPARRASRLQLTDALRLDTAGGGSRQRVRQALVIAQVAVSALLIFWSGLFARSLLHADTVNPGFDPTDVLIAEVPLSNDLPGGTRRQDALIVEIGQHVAALGGVDSAGWSSIVPLAMTSNERFRVARGTRPLASGGSGWWRAGSGRAGSRRSGCR